jgi:hypothetical protein
LARLDPDPKEKQVKDKPMSFKKSLYQRLSFIDATPNSQKYLYFYIYTFDFSISVITQFHAFLIHHYYSKNSILFTESRIKNN